MRICESDSAECTGINPCPHCYAFIFAKVLPGVIHAGGFKETPVSAEARLRAYDEGWRRSLGERVTEKNAALPSALEPYTTGTLLEFLAFKEARRERLALKKKLDTEAGITTKTESVLVTDLGANGLAEAVESPPVTKGKSEKSSAKLVRGDVKRMAVKQAKQSLAPGNGIHGDSGKKASVTGSNAGANNGIGPATRGTGRH